MSKVQLRKYQTEAIEQIEGAIALGSTEISLNGPTSFGKTITMGKFIKDQIDEGKSVVFMMNLTTLVEQTMETLKSLDVPFKVVAAEYDKYEFDHRAKVTIAMQQTLYSRIDKIDLDCDVLVIDEFHRSFRTDTMEAVKVKLKPDVIVGISGTNYDEKGYALPHVDIIETKTIRELTNDKFLTPLKVYSTEFAEEIDYSEAGSGEYSENFLNGVINNDSYNKQVVTAWQKVASGKKTIVFSTGIDHSEALAAQFNHLGIPASAYHSKMSKKEAEVTMASFKRGTTLVLVSVNKILVGFDDPSIECGIACRPTRTRRVWQQACGRMIRLFEGKKEAILLDCAQWTAEHGFYDAHYHPPKHGDKEALKKAKDEVAIQVMTTIVEPEPTLIDRIVVLKKVKELENKRKQIPELDMKDLLAIYNTSQFPIEILRIAHEINFRKTGADYTKDSVSWISNGWDEMLAEFPQYSTRLLKTLRTMARNKVAQAKKLSALHYVVLKETKNWQTKKIEPGWLRQQTPYQNYILPDSTDVSDEVAFNYAEYGLEENEIPF